MIEVIGRGREAGPEAHQVIGATRQRKKQHQAEDRPIDFSFFHKNLSDDLRANHSTCTNSFRARPKPMPTAEPECSPWESKAIWPEMNDFVKETSAVHSLRRHPSLLRREHCQLARKESIQALTCSLS